MVFIITTISGERKCWTGFLCMGNNSKGVKPCISNLHKLQNTLKNGDKFGLFGVQNAKAFVDQSSVAAKRA